MDLSSLIIGALVKFGPDLAEITGINHEDAIIHLKHNGRHIAVDAKLIKPQDEGTETNDQSGSKDAKPAGPQKS